ncbi:FemAB family XrtA/PEP-CTERM system-associated protein [Mucisphaera calidilacus]|uniref:FemAB family protein n=1 Tax=Mucisphaera calidilacus TaxID=2527982 RepID=A0A518BXB6_9BACT|nr:FemAB family XrtA/PEP-CTERM system-associated protein [Mucisphaera calidilacus]QDU71617.1 FemAB family protein [Mucisphaera calidilacus]
MIETHTRPEASTREHILAYLRAHPHAAPELHPAWLTALRTGLAHEPTLLIHRTGRSGDIRGLLPLAWVRSRLFGRFLVSLPFLNRAGVLADDPDAATRLIDAAVQLARQGRADYLELRHAGQPTEHRALTETRDDKPRMILDLPGSPDKLWDGFKAKVRNQVRKADRYHPAITFGRHELLDGFYSVFAVTMRDLGTPVYPKRFFRAILDALPDHAELALVTIEEAAVAGALLIHDPVHNHTTQVPSAACLRSANSMNANMFMYHHLLNRAIERSASRFDFGRSTLDSGTYRFKKQWGAQPEPTHWQQMPLHGDTHAARPDNPRYQSRIETWRKLPVWLTRVIGPPIVRCIP